MISALLLAAALSQAPAKNARPAEEPAPRAISPKSFTKAQQIAIKADRLEIQGRGNQAVWVGHVRARRGDTHLSCDRLVAHYNSRQEISNIECIGSVEIKDGDRWAKGERADFDNIKGILTVTGNPEARQGLNQMKGTRVTFYMERDLIEVQGAEAIIHPRALNQEQGKKKP